ncbi:PD-(D/E)XK nuclease superfamily protein [Reichenbachiella agariperforans]|uniref:PD-(D/E)XK nuclease superfamily protein n=1 Tax=Reichenbachiella agariperforans TaxID=156994 RepID=A0A1M6KSS4_REIAG|nr:PD-(D/E)XK nuclease family protein [Reichenbachiella agariperforans]SHJ62008.1 PD-(D/E)XK nuclease superfamily protein [Reichenbachiella agariperforans]
MEGIKSLLASTKRIRLRQTELATLRGENFNVFSILKMESKENETHSAFLGELLNPKGSHLFNTTFLSLFLEEIDYQGDLQLESAQLTIEKHIGARNTVNQSGGRIDIYISDSKGNSISIENKIYAGDQEAQILRYVNHNKESNKVYYLTLDGKGASEDSKGELIEEQDYHCISYHHSITGWLEKCMKEAADQPILRESIKQYILLIKKLTNQLSDSQMEKEIKELIANDYLSAKAIESSLINVEIDAIHSFLLGVKSLLSETLKEGWEIIVDDQLDQNWKGLSISYKDWGGIRIKLEGQSKIWTQPTIYGIHAQKDFWDRDLIKSRCSKIDIFQSGFKETFYWPYSQNILSFEKTEEKVKLFDESERNNMIEEVVTKLSNLALACKVPLSDIEKISIS